MGTGRLHGALEELVSHSASERRNLFIGGILIAGFGGLAWAQWPAARPFAYFCLAIGLLMILAAKVSKPDALRDILIQQPRSIAWYYPDPKPRLLDDAPALAAITIYIHMQDGAVHTPGVPMSRMSHLLDALAKVAPDAEVGYTADLERDFFSYLASREDLARRGSVPTFAAWRRDPLAYGVLGGLRGHGKGHAKPPD